LSEIPNDNSDLSGADMDYIMHNTIKSVTKDLEHFQFNTSVSRLMEFYNAISKYQRKKEHSYSYLRQCIETFVLLIAPLLPHYAEEIWESLGNDYSVFRQNWPIYDEAKIKRNMVEIAVQINGKLRDVIEISVDASDDESEKLVLALPKIQLAIKNMEIRKIIHVEKRLINIVLGK